MAQWYLRARALSLLRAKASGLKFKARGADRDAETDRARIASILEAINVALAGAEAEYGGLGRRMDDVLAQAALSLGNGTDEYLTRDSTDTRHIDLLEADILAGQRRLEELAASITQFKFLKGALLGGFPDFKPEPPAV